jgi:hypothetical protein
MQLDLTNPFDIVVGLLPEVLLSCWALIVLLAVSWRHQSAEDSRLAGWLSFAEWWSVGPVSRRSGSTGQPRSAWPK